MNNKEDTMKVVAFNGSARKNGNTTILIEKRKT
jgi:multimeric flavodoxin WrbA